MDFISGEIFQSLTQISFTKPDVLIYDQMDHKSQNLKLIDEFPCEEIKKYNLIFCYTHYIDDFLHKFFEYLSENTILITHNSDALIDSKYEKFLNSNKIKKWFTQNKDYDHPKLYPLPIGIARSQFDHGNLGILKNVINENIQKNHLLNNRFKVETNISHRQKVNQEIYDNGFGWTESCSETFLNHLRHLKGSYFCISPHGNGIDCHRLWESLYVGTIPIVPKRNVFYNDFKHLPILFVDDYKNVTKEFLEKQIDIFYPFSKYNLEMLDFNYWKDKILK